MKFTVKSRAFQILSEKNFLAKLEVLDFSR